MGRVLSGGGALPAPALAGGGTGDGAWIPVLIHMFAERALGDAGWMDDNASASHDPHHGDVMTS